MVSGLLNGDIEDQSNTFMLAFIRRWCLFTHGFSSCILISKYKPIRITAYRRSPTEFKKVCMRIQLFVWLLGLQLELPNPAATREKLPLNPAWVWKELKL